MKVILIAGHARHGKDSVASIMSDELKNKGKRVLIIHYADYLKYFLQKYYNWDGKKDEKGRQLLQNFSSQIVRNNYSDTWVDIVIAILKGVCTEYDYVLIPDTRFPNEINKMKEIFDCFEIKVYRPNFENNLTPEQRRHISETALDLYDFDHIILNYSDFSQLKKDVKYFTNKFLGD